MNKKKELPGIRQDKKILNKPNLIKKVWKSQDKLTFSIKIDHFWYIFDQFWNFLYNPDTI